MRLIRVRLVLVNLNPINDTYCKSADCIFSCCTQLLHYKPDQINVLTVSSPAVLNYCYSKVNAHSERAMTSRKRAGKSWQAESGDNADFRGDSGDTMIKRYARCFVYASCVFVCAF